MASSNYRDPNRPGGYANPMEAGQRRTPDEIERDIEATRARIEARLEGLSSQTAPSRLLESTLGADLSSPSDTINSLYLRARSNPLSAGLIAAGLIALYLGRRTEDPVAIAQAKRRAEYDDGREVPGPATRDTAERVAYDIAALKGHARAVGDDVSAARARLSSSVGQTRDATAASADAASAAVADASASVSRKADSLVERAKETYEDAAESVSAAYESVSERVASAYEGASESLSHAPDYARERARYAGSWVQENPLAAGMIGLAAGAVAASIFTASRARPPRREGRETRNLYREADGYSTSEELQRYATRRPVPVASTTGFASRPPRAGRTSDTRTSAVPGAANPARSTASQAARRAPATAAETVNKTTTTSASSTVGKTHTEPRTASSTSPSRASSTSKPSTGTGGRTSGTASAATGSSGKGASKSGKSGSNKPAPSASGTTYTQSPSKGGDQKPKK